jgi:hypothetical protein
LELAAIPDEAQLVRVVKQLFGPSERPRSGGTQHVTERG